MSGTLAQISDAMKEMVGRASLALAAIRLGPDHQRSALLWQPELAVTAEAALPSFDACSVARPGGALIPARLERRDAGSGLAAVRLSIPGAPRALSHAAIPAPGALVVILAASAEAAPIARLAMVQAGADPGRVTTPLDTALAPEDSGGPVLDAAGRLLGLALSGPDGTAHIAPAASIAALFGGAALTPGRPDGPRGWLGLSLQPVEGSGRFRWLGGGKGRRVIGMYAGGPGAQAGIMVGDILLTVDGKAIAGSGTLRDYLSPERVGSEIDIRLLRDGHVRTCRVTVAPLPGED